MQNDHRPRPSQLHSPLLLALAALAAPGLAQTPQVTWQVSPAEAHHIEVSADGTKVVYEHSYTEFGGWITSIYLHDRLGGSTVEVAKSPVPPKDHESILGHGGLSADGRYVAYSGGLGYTGGGMGGPVYIHQVMLIDTTTGQVETISVTPTGAGCNRSAYPVDVSADGRFVLFTSFASDLVAGDALLTLDLFLRDRSLGTTVRVSETVDGASISSNDIHSASISDDGSLVAFSSDAYNLAWPYPSKRQVFVRHMGLGVTVVASETGAGVDANGHCSQERLSPDGRYLVFRSSAANLVQGDTNLASDIFCKDLLTGALERVSVDSFGAEGDDSSGRPDVSGDGRYVVFESYATNLAPYDTNGNADVFQHDRWAGVTRRVSVDDAGDGTYPAIAPSLSADGRFVAFQKATPPDFPGFPCCSPAFLHDARTGGPFLALSNVIAGASLGLDVLGATPGGGLLLGWSVAGQGVLPSAFGLTDLAPPFFLLPVVADGAGLVHLDVGLPPAALGLELWVQGADPTTGLLTNARGAQVQ